MRAPYGRYLEKAYPDHRKLSDDAERYYAVTDPINLYKRLDPDTGEWVYYRWNRMDDPVLIGSMADVNAWLEEEWRDLQEWDAQEAAKYGDDEEDE